MHYFCDCDFQYWYQMTRDVSQQQLHSTTKLISGKTYATASAIVPQL